MDHPPAAERSELLIVLGWFGAITSFVPVLTLVATASLTDHDLLADTVSDLGRGKYAAVMDTGFYINAAGLLGLTIAAAHAHIGRLGWSFGILCLALLALNVTLIGIWDAFGQTAPEAVHISVHTRLTYGLGILYLAGPLLMVSAMRKASTRIANLFVASAILWIIFAAGFKLSPDSHDGIIEKVAIAFTLLWTVPLSYYVIQRGYARTRNDG